MPIVRKWKPKETGFGDGSLYIQLTRGKRAIIDRKDLDLILKMRSWSTNNVRSEWKHFYAVSKRNVKMHRYIMGVTDPKICIDHINGDGLDNRRKNLRKCTLEQNRINKIRRVSSKKYRGVTKRGKNICAQIKKNGKPYYLGSFKTEEAAYRAYIKMGRKLFGKWFPTDDVLWGDTKK